MGYGKELLTAAAEKAGSRYALWKLTGIPQSHLSEAMSGTRGVPASWVLKLARVAGVDPTEAMENHDLEQAEKKRQRRRLSLSAAAGVVAVFASFGSSAPGSPAEAATGTSPTAEFHGLSIVSFALRRLLARMRRSVYQDAGNDTWRTTLFPASSTVPG